MNAPKTLTIHAVLPTLASALAEGTRAVLQAPPGAGKTTVVPLALLDAPWLAGGKVLMLEPRRLAARAAAAWMARGLGEAVGETVGYRVRLDSRVGPRTRIEVITEGILTRRLQADPGLEGIGALIFDEFHERSLDADLGLALALETQAALREDLRIVVMSATLDGARIAKLLGGAPVIAAEGRLHPVDTRWIEPPPHARIEDAVAAAVRKALAEEPGSLLVFLPGEGEIRRVAERLNDLPPDVHVTPLYGALAKDSQDEAIAPAPPDVRKIVLASAIAETSLTIEGVRVVVDSGWARVARFDPARGMSRLDTVRVSQASAEQRRGRAGRTEPGVCYRLWPEAAHKALAPYHRPEILETDLAGLALDLAQWGVADPSALAWLDPPPPAALAQATALLKDLGALDDDGRITPHGRAMAALPLHPRLAHMVLRGRAMGLGALACDLAALLGERDILGRAGNGESDADIRTRLDVLAGDRAPAGLSIRRGALTQAKEAARRWRRQLGIADEARSSQDAGRLLALAYPERVARRRDEPGGFRLAGGRGAVLPLTDPLAAEDWLAVGDLDGGTRDARIFLAAPLALSEIEELFADRIAETERMAWNHREQAVQATRQRRFGDLVLAETPLKNPAPEAMVAAMIDGIRDLGLASLPWSEELRDWQARLAFLRRVEGEAWPDVSDPALTASLDHWLAPYLSGITRRAHLARIDLGGALRGLLTWAQRKALDDLAPTHVTVPSGSVRRIDYAGEIPVLAVRLQEMFGLARGPAVAGGKVPLLLHLLSPAQRPIQVTRDLAGFWANTYAQVRSELRGRYPKHVWPDDPLTAPPTRRAKPRES